MNEVAKMLTKSKNSRLEKFGKTITFLCMSLIVVVVAMILIFVAQKGLSTFFVNKVNIFSFLFGSSWNPAAKGIWSPTHDSRFLYCNLAFCPLGNAVCHWCSSFHDRSLPKGARFLQPAIELLVGIPSVVYGFHWPSSGRPILRVVSLEGLVWDSLRGLCPLCYDPTNCHLYDDR